MVNPGLDVALSGRTALVCGASGGIGLATAEILAAQGARVFILARRESELKKALASLPGQGHEAVVCDLSDLEQIRSKVGALVKQDPIEILICNAGGPKGGPIAEAEPQAFAAAFQQHVLANQILVQICLPGMKEKKYGRIVNVISTSVKIPIPGLGVSNTIRAAVASWAKTLSQEVASFGVTVNSVLPGYTETDRLSQLLKAGAQNQGKSEDQLSDEWLKTIPARRFGKASEIASVIGFLASPAAAYVNGTAIPVDGGRTGSL